MLLLQWAACLFLGVTAALLIPLQWFCLVGLLIAKGRGHGGGVSLVFPFVGGVAGALACVVCPGSGVLHWSWLLLLLDPSIGLLLLSCVADAIARMLGRRSLTESPADAPPR